ncbi:MAG: (Fe-S)-binding protein, partial [Conexivisphaera sp.]
MDNEPREAAAGLAGGIRELLGGAADVAALCMRCGFCNAACPTSSVPSAYMESRTSRGRAVLFRELLSGGSPGDPMSEEVAADMEYCMGCGRCMNACPLEVPIPLLVGAYRELRAREAGRSPAEVLLSRYDALDRLAGRLPALYNAASGAVKGPLARALGLREDLELPRASPRRPRLRSWRGGDVVLLLDTYTWAHDPDVPEAIWRLLVAMGLRPEVVGPLDHGMVLLDVGYVSRMKEEGRRLVEELSRAAGGRTVVAVSPASYYMLRRIYPLVIGEDARRLARSVVDVYELALRRC